MMKEAQQMMQDPSFQANMKQMMDGQGFQQAMAKTKTDLKDPEKLLEMEAKAVNAIKEGNKELEEMETKKREQVTAAVLKAQEAQRLAEEKKNSEDGDKKVAAEEEEERVPAFEGLRLN
jgi:hypothetical protein